MLREDQLRWTFKLYDASGDGVLEQQEVDDHVHDVHHGDHHVHHDHSFSGSDDHAVHTGSIFSGGNWHIQVLFQITH